MTRAYFRMTARPIMMSLCLCMILVPTVSQEVKSPKIAIGHFVNFDQSNYCQVFKCARCEDDSPWQCEYCNQGYFNYKKQCRKENCTDMNCVDCDEAHPKHCFLCTNGYSSFMSKCAPLWQFYILYGILIAVGIILVIALWFNLRSRRAVGDNLKDSKISPKKSDIEMPMLANFESPNPRAKKVHCGTDIGDLPNIFVTQRSVSIGSPVAVQKYPLGPQGGEITYKQEEWTFKDDGNLQVLNTQFMNIPVSEETSGDKEVVITESKAIKGNFLNLSEEMYEMIELSNNSNGGWTPASRSPRTLSNFSPVKAKKTVHFGGLMKEGAVVDDGHKKDSIEILQDLPETLNQETGL
jgi:hypothetical protein